MEILINPHKIEQNLDFEDILNHHLSELDMMNEKKEFEESLEDKEEVFEDDIMCTEYELEYNHFNSDIKNFSCYEKDKKKIEDLDISNKENGCLGFKLLTNGLKSKRKKKVFRSGLVDFKKKFKIDLSSDPIINLNKKTSDQYVEIYEDYYPNSVYVYTYTNFTDLVRQAFLNNSVDLDIYNNMLIYNVDEWSRANMYKRFCPWDIEHIRNISALKNIKFTCSKSFNVESMMFSYNIEIKDDNIIEESKKDKSFIKNILNNIQINFYNFKGKLIFRDYYFVIIDSNRINLLLPGANITLETLKDINTRLNTKENITNYFLEDYEDELVSYFEILFGHKNNTPQIDLSKLEIGYSIE